MKSIQLLLPFALPPLELAVDLVRQLQAPSLATLIARRSAQQEESGDPFSRALPHENWLLRQPTAAQSPSLPMAHHAMAMLSLAAAPGTWALAQPAHLHVARDHLVLTDLRQLQLSVSDSRALFDAAAPLFEESGKQLMYGDEKTWFVQADDWRDLRTTTPNAACGHNIDIWMPRGEGERDWRKLQNEIQMTWHTHPVNASREQHGDKAINALWLWGISTASEASTGEPAIADHCPGSNPVNGYRSIVPSAHADAAASLTAVTEAAEATKSIGHAPQVLVVADQLISPALAGDWSSWLTVMQHLEEVWFAPLLAAVDAGRMQSAEMILTDGTRLRRYQISRLALKKFWIKPSLGSLLS